MKPSLPNQQLSKFFVALILGLAFWDNLTQNAYLGMQVWIVTAFHLNYSQAAWLGVAGDLGALGATIPLAFLADRISRPWVIGVGALMWSLLTSLAGLSTGFLTLFLFLGFSGLGSASYDSQASGIWAGAYPPARRSRMIGWQQFVELIGASVGVALSVGFASTVGWRWAFVLCSAPALFFALALLRQPDPSRAAYEGESGSVEPWRTALQGSLRSLRSWGMGIATLGRALQEFSLHAIGVFLPLYLVRYAGFSDSEASSVFLGVVVFAIGGVVLGGWGAGRRHPEVALVVR